jgi:hypothetical protein
MPTNFDFLKTDPQFASFAEFMQVVDKSRLDMQQGLDKLELL